MCDYNQRHTLHPLHLPNSSSWTQGRPLYVLQQLLVGLNRQRRDIQQLRGTAPMQFFHGAAQLEAYAAATTPFCSTPRLVLGPDGQQLALARKLKQQNLETEPKSAVDSNHAEVGLHVHHSFHPATSIWISGPLNLP